MKLGVSRSTNEDNLRFASRLLKGIEHCVFFGTLLGLIRDGRLIEGDDDVDIYVASHERDRVITRLEEAGLAVDLEYEENTTPHFLQVRRHVAGETGLLDFYFVEVIPERQIVLDRWNFMGRPEKENTHLHVPMKLLFPASAFAFGDTEVMVPNDPGEAVQFIYGPSWNVPLSKDGGYYVQVINNVPKTFVGPTAKFRREVFRFLGQLGLLKFG